MNEAVILHTIEDVKDCLKKKLHNGRLLFSTYAGVDVYLKEYYNIKCQCLSEFVTTKEAIDYKNTASETVDRILNDLDLKISPLINEQFNLKMKYFVPLYAYLSKSHFLVYMWFIETIKRIRERCKLNKIYFYENRFNSYFDVNTDISYLVSVFFKDLDAQIIKSSYHNKFKYPKINRAIGFINKVRQRPLWAAKLFLSRLSNQIKYRRLSNNKKTVLLYEDLYEVDFLKQRLNKYNVLYYGFKSRSSLRISCDNGKKINIDFGKFVFDGKIGDPLIQIFLKDIKDDFTKNIGNYIAGITSLREINKRYPISLGIWGNSPIQNLRPLIFEYLISEKIKVLGSQHGGGYGDFFEPWHFDSDFSHCNYFLTCGFTKQDIQRLYPQRKSPCEFIPVGKVKLTESHKAKKRIDIFFPITTNLSMLTLANGRILPHRLIERQIMLLEYLNSLKGLSVYIKPFPTSLEDCAVFPIFKRLKNLKVVTNMLLSEFLKKYRPKIVLMEFFSQPLYECLCLPDPEIFVMNDDLHPSEKQALSELKKRVHYAEEINEIIEQLNLFLEGKLEKKRDQTFYNHYLYRRNPKENILRLIETLVNNNNK